MEHVSERVLFDSLEDQEGGLSLVPAAGIRNTVLPSEWHHPQGPEPGNTLTDAEPSVKLVGFGLRSGFPGHKLSRFGHPLLGCLRPLWCQTCDRPGVEVGSPGVVLYRMVMGTLSFVGEDFGKWKQHILHRHFHVPYFMSIRCQTLKKKKKNKPGRYNEGPMAQHEPGRGTQAL